MGVLPATRPVSAAHRLDGIWTTVAVITGFWFLRESELDSVWLAVSLVGVALGTMGFVELVRAPWHRQPRHALGVMDAVRSTVVPWLGEVLGMAGLVFMWWLLTHFRTGRFDEVYAVFQVLVLPTLVVMFVGMSYSTWRLGKLGDRDQQLGLLATGRWSRLRSRELVQEILVWLIRGIFLPLFVFEASKIVGDLRVANWSASGEDVRLLGNLVLHILYGLILTIVIPGHVVTCRLLNNHARYVDTSLAGWVLTLCMYTPLAVRLFLFDFMVAKWNMLIDEPMVLWGMFLLIMLVEGVNYWAEAHLGIRSSNLTHKGLITNGPFRWTRHPAYVTKCLGWLLVWLPFMAGPTLLDCVRLSLLYLIVCGIYLGRAWTEERLMSIDPNYVAYAMWIDKHGLFARLGRWSPVLTYAWRYERWIKPSLK